MFIYRNHLIGHLIDHQSRLVIEMERRIVGMELVVLCNIHLECYLVFVDIIGVLLFITEATRLTAETTSLL